MSGAEKGSNFYLGFLFLPERRREALSAVYAYCRRVDDIVDDGELEKTAADAELDGWRDEIEALYSGSPRDPIAVRLQPFVREFDLPKEAFLGLIDGMRMDLKRSRYETAEDLEKYLFGAAGTVGLLCVKIFGYAHTSEKNIRSYAVAMGNAMQLTNILRDVGADLEKGRVYLPMKDLAAAGVRMEDLTARKYTPEFERMMEGQWERARGYFKKARSLLDPGDARSMLPAEVMAAVYEDLLVRIREERYRVLFGKIRVPGWRKACLAARTWFGVRFRAGRVFS